MVFQKKTNNQQCVYSHLFSLMHFSTVSTQGVTAVCCPLTNHWSASLEKSSLCSLLDSVIYELLTAICSLLLTVCYQCCLRCSYSNSTISPYLSLHLSDCKVECRHHKGRNICKNPSVPWMCCLCVRNDSFFLAVFPESRVAWLEVCLLCTAVPAMFPVHVIMRLFAEDCGKSNGQWLDWPAFSKSPLLKAMAFQLAANHMVTFGMSKCTCCFWWVFSLK